MHDFQPAEGDHHAELFLDHQPRGVDAQPGSQHPVVGAGGATPLQVAEGHVAGLDAGAAFDEVGDRLGDPPEADVAEVIDLGILGDHSLQRELGPFAGNHQSVRLARLATALQHRAHLFDVDFFLGNQHVIGGGGDARETGNPACMPAHGLDDHDPAVRFGGRADAVDRFHHDVDGGVETEGEVGAVEIVVDGFGDTDHRELEVLVQPLRHPEGVVATNRDQGVKAESAERFAEFRDRLRLLVGVGPRRPQDGPPPGDDLIGLDRLQGGGVPADCPPPALQEAMAFPSTVVDGPHHGSDHGV